MKMIKNRISFVIMLALLSVLSFTIAFSTPISKADASETVVAVTVEDADFAMVKGAAVRVHGQTADDNGLRFVASLSDSDYEGIMLNVENGVYSDIEFGVFIMPYDYIAEYGDLTEENLFGSQEKEAVYDWATWTDGGWSYTGNKTRIINIYAYEMKESVSGGYYIDGSITKLHDENIARDFVSAAYIKYTEDGVVKYEMADYVEDNQRSNVRSMAYVAQKAIAYTGEDACDDDQKDWLNENYIAKAVVDNTKTDFGYVDKSATADYTFTLEEGVTALRVTTSDVEYSEVPFTCEEGVLSIAKSVVDAGISAGYLANGENTVYIHTVDESGEYPVYKVQEECLVVADKVVMNSDVPNLKNVLEDNRTKYVVLGEDLNIGELTSSIYVNTSTDLEGTLDGRGHGMLNIKLNGIGSVIASNKGTVKNLYADVVSVENYSHESGKTSSQAGYKRYSFVRALYGCIDNVYIRYSFCEDVYTAEMYSGTIAGNVPSSGYLTNGEHRLSIRNSIAEMNWNNLSSPISTTNIGGVLGSNVAGDYAKAGDGSPWLKNCYAITNGVTLNYSGESKYNGGNVLRRGTNSYCKPANSAVYSDWDEFGASVSTLSAEDGWSKFWTFEEDNGQKIFKLGGNEICRYYL